MKKLFLLALAGLLAFGTKAQEQNPVIDQISSILSQQNQKKPLESIYLITDKDIYAPGEIIWFHALVFDRSTRMLSSRSTEMDISFIDNKGNIIQRDYYALDNGVIRGDFKIPEGIQRGRFYVAACTPFQTLPDPAYTRLIYIDQPYKTDLIIQVEKENEIFDAGMPAKILLTAKSLENIPEPRLRLDYELYLGDELIEEDRIRTDNDGNASIDFEFPEKTGILPLTLVIYENKNYWEKTIAVKTNRDRLMLEFMPEGGHLISGIPQKLGFVSRDIFGNYLSVNAEIVDNQGVVMAKCQSFTDGFGLVPLQLKEGEKYRFLITSEYGKGLTFDLPAVENKTALAILGSDEKSISTYISSPPGESQKLVLTLTSGYRIIWAGEITVTGPSRFTIPCENCPEGILLLSAFDQNAGPIGQRLVNVNKNTDWRFSVESGLRNNIELSFLLSDSANKPVITPVVASVAAENYFLNLDQDLIHSVNYDAELEFILSPTPLVASGNRINKTALDYFLIANRLKGFNWENLLQNDMSNNLTNPGFTEEQLQKYIRQLDLRYAGIDVSREKMLDFLRKNEALVLDAPKKAFRPAQPKTEPAYKSLLQSSTSLLEVIQSIKSYSLSGDQIIFPGMLNSINSQMGAVIVVDGQNLGNSSSVLQNFHPLDIEEINVYTDPVQTQKYTGFASGGLIEIFTKKGQPIQSVNSTEPEEKNLYVNGYRIPREYNSVLNLLDSNDSKFSTTLYWNPELTSGEQPVKLNIPLSGITSGYGIRMIGFDRQGRMASYYSIIPVNPVLK